MGNASRDATEVADKPENKALVSAALKLLSRRDYSRTEFIKKLGTGEFDEADVEATADWCHAQGFRSGSLNQLLQIQYSGG